jgi:hypothetical protein
MCSYPQLTMKGELGDTPNPQQEVPAPLFTRPSNMALQTPQKPRQG